MNASIKKITSVVLVSALLFSACKKDPKPEPNDEEVITTLIVKLKPVSGGGATLEYKFDDADGPGGAAPTYQDIVLAPSTAYSAELILLNKLSNPVDTISKEVKEEADAHRFYYMVQNGANIAISNLDNDANGVPLGLKSTWTTGAVSTGKLQITLRHYSSTPPNKAVGDLVSDAKSSTDLTTTDTGGFNIRIQ